MKISYLTNLCCYGGTETAIKNRMDYLKDIGVECQIIFLWRLFEEEMFRDHKRFVTDSPEQILNITKDSDFVVAVSPYVYDKLQILDKNIIIESHFGPFEELRNQLYCKGAKAVIFPTKARLQDAKPYIPQGPSQFVVPNCLGKSFIKGTISPNKQLKKDVKEILWVGRIEDNKNWMMLPKLAERLPENYKIKVIAGAVGGYQIRKYKELLQKFEGKPYSNKIDAIINCPYDKIVDYYIEAAESGCYLSTSYYESFGMTVLEAMASACPLVLSNLTSFKEVARDSALYFNSDDVDACLDSIVKVCEDSSIRTSMLSKMKNIYELNFNPVKICNDYVNTLQSIMD